MRSCLARGTIACLHAMIVWASPLAAEPRTNQGAKLDSGTNFHTNPGGKYVYRGPRAKFHTNRKYVYRGFSAAPR